MPSPLIFLDRNRSLGLQAQIREQLVQAVAGGSLATGTRLPSSRQLAADLGIARNTVALAYQELVAEGWLESRDRSGIYVSDALLAGRTAIAANQAKKAPSGAAPARPRPTAAPGYRQPADWHQYPWPFLDGRYEPGLYPQAAWRSATRRSVTAAEQAGWAAVQDGLDDPALVAEVRTKVLPRRGVQAGPENILITQGARHATQLLAELLVGPGVPVGVEEPGPEDVRQLLTARGAALQPQPVDADGLVPGPLLARCKLLWVSPSFHLPTAVTMPMARRTQLLHLAEQHDVLVVEHDWEADLNYPAQPEPALAGLASAGRVVYIADIDRGVAPGLRLGVLVADEGLVAALRDLRQHQGTEPPANNQRTMACFLAMGHYDAMIVRQRQVLHRRRAELADALNHYLPGQVHITPQQGGTTWWVEGPPELDAQRLVRDAAASGVLVEPVEQCFGFSAPPTNCFRMGITSLPTRQIRAGVAALAEQIRAQLDTPAETLATAQGERLKGRRLRQALAGRTLALTTVSDEPLRIQLFRDGRMTGSVGHRGEDTDTGRWWLEDGHWTRQWQHWSYGEALTFHTVLDGQQLKWFKADGRLIDVALLQDSTA